MKPGLFLCGVSLFIFICSAHSAEEPFGNTGLSDNTTIIEDPGSDQDCPGELQCNWDGTIENGYCWRFAGVVPPDYGSWAECYDANFVCEGHFYFTQTGYYIGQTCDVYLWDATGIGSDGLPAPGNVLCVIVDASPGPIAFWPDCSVHKFVFNCDAPDHFVGFWGNWPGRSCGWFVCADEDGPPGSGCPVTKFSFGIGYPTGWGPVNLIPIFQPMALGLCEWVGPPTSTARTTWGKIKSLY